MAMGMLPGDELVADYLARVGRAAENVLPPPECTAVVKDISRQVRACVGLPPRRDADLIARRLAELGEPEQLVVSAARASGRPSVTFPGRPADDDNPTLDLGRVPAPARPDRIEVRVADPGEASPRGLLGGIIRTLPDFRDRDRGRDPGPSHGLRVRPIEADESVRGESMAGLGRLAWELAALFVLGVGVFVFGFLAWIVGALLVTRSRFWEISDKVRVLLGFPAAAVVVSVLWAWVRATQIQESNDSGTRVSVAGHSLADSLAVMPGLIGVSAALYLAYALVRDHHAG